MSPLRSLIDRARRDRRVLLMGVLNVTPDSFSDGGLYMSPTQAKKRVDEILESGADVVDVGGESTRPGAPAVGADEQIARIEPALVYAARERHAVVSVDTTSAEVASHALSLGASVVNDVSCLADPELARVVAEHRGSLVIMHARGPMSQMRGFSDAPTNAYGDVVRDVKTEWLAARARAVRQGLGEEEIWFDPGLGYMKNALHSLELLRRLGEFGTMGAPVVVGPSRKSFLAKAMNFVQADSGAVSEEEPRPGERLGGTIAACLSAADGGATMLRVHDVFEVRQALVVHRAIRGAHA